MALEAASGKPWALGANWGVNASTVADHAGTIDASIAAYVAAGLPAPEVVLINLGVNDVATALPDEATWKADYGYILDAYHAAFPSTTIYVTKPWFRAQPARCVTIAGWIDTILGTRGPWAVVGDLEATWLEGGDNGATMTVDGTHYSVAGAAAKVAQVLTLLGY